MTAVATSRRDSPYQGLVPFGPDDWPFFFGRERDTDLIVANLYAEPLTLLYGATGVGKTSTLQAGVLHRLREEDDAVAVTFGAWQGRGEARQRLRQAISGAWGGTPSNERSLLEAAETLVEKSSRNVMIILDQFEEYFLYHRSGDPLEDELVELLTQRELPVGCLLSLREDALAALDRFKDSVPGLFDNSLRVHHLDHDSAIEAIVRPLEQYSAEHGVRARASSKLPERVLSDLERTSRDRTVWTGETGADESYRIEAPYLQLIMDELWRAERDAGSYTIHRRTLDRLGGTTGIVHGYLDKRLGALNDEDQDTASKLFRFLVTPSGSKIALTKTDLADFADLPPTTIAPVLETLTTSGWLLRRVLPPDGDPEGARYELVHDVLAEEVAAWRRRRLERVAEAEHLMEHGTTLSAVTDAFLRKRREEAEGALSAETDSRLAAQLAAFARHDGQIVAYWLGDSGNSVFLLRRDPSGASGADWQLRFQIRRAPVDEDLTHLLFEADALATAASESVSAGDEELILRQLFGLVTSILTGAEQPGADPGPIVAEATRSLSRIHDYLRLASTRAAQLAYARGMAFGLAGLLCLVGLAWLVVHFTVGVTTTVEGVMVAAASGATGATVSVLRRMTAGALTSYAIPRNVARLSGALRPLIGAIFGMTLYLVFRSGAVPASQSDNLYFVAALAFLAGFAERFAQDAFVTSASKTLEPATE
jgi:hypothetical protein